MTCVGCLNVAELLCQRCRTAYCSRKCQAKDWPEHKTNCIPMPPLVVAKKTDLLKPKRQPFDSQRLRQQTNDSQKSRQQTFGSQKPKQQAYDLQKPKERTADLQKPKERTADSQNTKQQTDDLQKPKEQTANSHNTNQQTDDLQKLKEQTANSQNTKQQTDDLPKPKEQTTDSQNTKQQTNDLQQAKELRPPKTKLPSQIIPSLGSKISLFDNPFKRNSQNIGFKANDIKNNNSPPASKMLSVNETEKTETIAQGFHKITQNSNDTKNEPSPPAAKMTLVSETGKTETKELPSPGELNPVVSIPAKYILTKSVLSSAETSEANDEKTEIIVKQCTLAKLSAKEVIESQQMNGKDEAIFTMSDIEIIPLGAGKKIVCLDSTNIADGYISSCVSDGKAVAFISRLSAKITEYVNGTTDPYRPQCGELCLCLFDEDNEWYRAVVSKVIASDTFEISFIDFGNVVTACSKNIRKMPREFLHHCLVNKCYIKGFSNESPETKLKLEEFLLNTPIFEPEKLEVIEKGIYEIELKFDGRTV